MSDSIVNTTNNKFDIKKFENQITPIVTKYHPEKIILFGSYVTGNPTPDSDIDLLIIMNTEKSTWDMSVEISLMMKHIYPIDIIVKTPQEIEKRINYGDFFIKEIMNNGKVLYEHTRKGMDSKSRG